MNAQNSTTSSLPLDDWRNYLILAKKGLLNFNQLIYKCEELKNNGEMNNALTLYQAYIDHTQNSDKDLALFNLGAMLQAAGQIDLAETSYRACLAAGDRLPQARINLGLVLEKKGKTAEAIELWKSVVLDQSKSLEDTSNIVLALNHIGRVYENHKLYELAESALEESLKINPKQPNVIQHWVHIRQKSCAWPVYKELSGITQNEMLMATSPLAMLALTDDPIQQLLTAFAFVERTYGFKEENLSQGRHYKHNRIRIGYVSGDLCVHAVGLLLPELIEGHDRSKVEIYGYDFSPEDGTPHRARIKQAFDHLRSIQQLSDEAAARLILDDEIDVLIDLHGLSSGARPGIFARHPAPRQGTYLGFIGTTGMPWFDFVVADRFVLPPENVKYFTEKPLYVDGCFLPFSISSTPTKDVVRSEFGIPENAFVMAAFGNVYKITEDIFNIWMKILKEVPSSVLWLIDDNPTTTKNLLKHAIEEKISPEKIIFTPRSAYLEYKAKLRLADIFLDNFPYNCGSTSADVLAAGIPLITLTGKSMVSKMGGSILKTLDCDELICKTSEAYIQTCKKLAEDVKFRKKITKKIKANYARLLPQKIVSAIDHLN